MDPLNLVLDGVELVSHDRTERLISIDHLTLPDSQIYGVIGGNLSGRSALMRLIGGGFLPVAATSGTIQLARGGEGNVATLRLSPHSTYVGPDPQGCLSTLTATVADEVLLHESLRDPEVHINLETDAWSIATAFGLDRCSGQSPMQLSGGQTAALALVSALVLARPVLCVDETLAQLDVERRKKAWSLLRRFADRGGLVLITENSYDLMAEHCEHFLYLSDGRVDGPVQGRTVFASPRLVERALIPNSTRLALQAGLASNNPPTRYRELLSALRERLRRVTDSKG